ncbi:MAG: hypothetical protein LBD53_04895 [Tannerella sp.]|nr:hypothetical protein [Tannerella sp.]
MILLLIACFATLCTSLYIDWHSSYGEYSPVFMERSELEKSVFYVAGKRELENPGKIYSRAPYIFINERYKGVHVIDNTDPSKPINVGFIVAPGCIDMAVKGEVMYLDNAIDLVAIDLNTKKVTHRQKDVFPEPNAPNGSYYHVYNRPSQTSVLVAWKKNQ